MQPEVGDTALGRMAYTPKDPFPECCSKGHDTSCGWQCFGRGTSERTLAEAIGYGLFDTHLHCIALHRTTLDCIVAESA